MRFLSLIAALLAGLVAGLGLTALVARDGIVFDRRQLGAWSFAPRIGSELIDPYARARMLVSGELPLANGEGFSLVASVDENGETLSARCTYRVSGPLPAARFWTLTITTPNGQLLDTPLRRSSFTSAEVLRFAGEPFAIEIGARPLPGNWLPTPASGAFLLTLRLYETPLSATATVLDPAMLPRVERVGCTA
ncbi:MAG: DUF1214 domain-containing protein [Beijerinckiaceae bacterium]|jgi:hypothetical protein|nr:DUF1214 domain-containing protein [Beijerinckiaceae bacterium]